MAHTFKLNKESLKREFSVYVVIVHGNKDDTLYVGKTGDNREGCNPIISRCGNHFSYNKIHSQIRNKIDNHEDCEYTYIFDHFGEYSDNKTIRKKQIDEINEMERWLNKEIQEVSKKYKQCTVANPYKGTGYVKKAEKEYRKSFRTSGNQSKITSIVNAVESKIKS
ncbi:MAG: hypothetical protein JMN27_18325 [gamma proteobacterium endosymbiont of Lamellibrachia anaximandri]|nr:hypothetical protein [gamma proteobacterium endosymbiont of Lamellibrachia anaximandri]MBL3535762.1 hypothetical protein [gamma proteobacterium endosymbiont of Lamellibrachia anaximandri]